MVYLNIVQAKVNLYPHNPKNAILFVEIYRKDDVFYEFSFQTK
ncbi:hypothetical protein MGA3_16476 [Bacillus methanolicus MGA3]|nr:hypothetical protein MGA3_16476 [Bacillus methanolicus MGA3]